MLHSGFPSFGHHPLLQRGFAFTIVLCFGGNVNDGMAHQQSNREAQHATRQAALPIPTRDNRNAAFYALISCSRGKEVYLFPQKHLSTAWQDSESSARSYYFFETLLILIIKLFSCRSHFDWEIDGRLKTFTILSFNSLIRADISGLSNFILTLFRLIALWIFLNSNLGNNFQPPQ